MIRQVPQETWLLAPQPFQVSPAEGTGHIEDESAVVEDVVPRQGTKKARKRQSFIKIRLPSWMSSRVWLLGMNRAETGWDLSLRTMNMIPGDAPIFLACMDGDLATVRRLLTSGAASIHDTAIDLGYKTITPLQVSLPFATSYHVIAFSAKCWQLAAGRGDIELSRFLLAAGRRADQVHVSRAAMGCWDSDYFISHSESKEIEALMLKDLILHEDFLIEDLEWDGCYPDAPLCRGPWDELATMLSWHGRWLTPGRLGSVKRHLGHSYSSWPLLARIQIARNIAKADMKPSSWMELCGLPTSVETVKILSKAEASCFFSAIVRRLGSGVDEDVWIDHALSLSEGNEGAAFWAFLENIVEDYNEDPIHSLRRRLGVWLHALLRQGIDLGHFGKEVEAQWACSPREIWIDPHRANARFFSISDVLHGPSYSDWGLKLDCERYFAVHRLCSAPGSWPTDFPLPGTTWSEPTLSDLEMGPWTVEDHFLIASVQEIQLADSDEDDFMDILYRLCIAAKDDHCPSLPSTRCSDFAGPTVMHGRRRSRSQPAFQRAAERADVIYHRVGRMYNRRYGRQLGVGFTGSKRFDALVESFMVTSVFEGIRQAWLDRVQDLWFDHRGLRACGCNSEERAFRFISDDRRWPFLDLPPWDSP